jgi:hypothetical protein
MQSYERGCCLCQRRLGGYHSRVRVKDELSNLISLGSFGCKSVGLNPD